MQCVCACTIMKPLLYEAYIFNRIVSLYTKRYVVLYFICHLLLKFKPAPCGIYTLLAHVMCQLWRIDTHYY